MSEIDNIWDTMTENWKLADDYVCSGAPSEERITKEVKKNILQIKLKMWVAVVASLALCVLIVSEIISGLPSYADIILFSGFLILALAIGIYTLYISVKSLSAATVDNRSHVDTLIQQSENELKLIKFNSGACITAFLLTLPVFLLVIGVGIFGEGLQFKHYLVGSMTGFCCIFFGVLFKKAVHKKLTVQQRIAFLTSLNYK
ncbi:hypothetical protein [Pseudoteredinibacter isoporae]|uniref:hypothetical protein n=1 Tax=Pseudoteredinibacter isoporae TaxID=570281 RepID=UPI0031091CC4